MTEHVRFKIDDDAFVHVSGVVGNCVYLHQADSQITLTREGARKLAESLLVRLANGGRQ